MWLSYLPVFITADLPRIPHTHVDFVSGVAAACSFIGECFLIKALLVYEAVGWGPPHHAGDGGSSAKGSRGAAEGRAAGLGEDVPDSPSAVLLRLRSSRVPLQQVWGPQVVHPPCATAPLTCTNPLPVLLHHCA